MASAPHSSSRNHLPVLHQSLNLLNRISIVVQQRISPVVEKSPANSRSLKLIRYTKVIIPKESHTKPIEQQSELRLIRNTYYSKSIPLIKFPNYLRKQYPSRALSPSLFGFLVRKYPNSTE